MKNPQVSLKIQCIVFLLFSFICYVPLHAEIIPVKPAHYTVDLPEGWKKLDLSDPARASFISADSIAVLKIMVYNGDKYPDAESFFKTIKKELKATGDGANFFFHDMDAVLADLTFSTGSFDVRGYTVFLNRENLDYALLTYCPVDYYEAQHDYLLSVLDSFSLDALPIDDFTPEYAATRSPGVISAFLVQSVADEMLTCKLILDKVDYSLEVSKNLLETSQDIINREARILAGFKTININAWQRFYRMIYRDNYQALEPVLKAANHRFAKLEKKEKIKQLLQWVQGFTYTRTTDIADLTSPLEAAMTAAGDCDSRVLLYITLLHYMGIDAVLLLSSAYSHAAAGISKEDYPGTGATVKLGTKQYLYTELTDKVAIGQIPAKMADPAKWIAVEVSR